MLPPKTYRTVKQPLGSRLCGVAVCAMIVGRGMRYVLNRIGTVKHQDGKPYSRTRHVLEFLGGHGVVCGMIVDVSSRISADMPLQFDASLRDRPSILSVRSESFGGCYHYVFWDGQRLHDPNPQMNDLQPQDYDIIEIIPLTYLDERPLKNNGDSQRK